MTKKRRLQGIDLFCGAGGFTTGAVQSGYVDMRLAINHWRTAVYSHQNNHKNTRHICARIDDVDPRNDKTLPACDLLLASPECTHHSNARSGRPIDDQKRATPWHVLVWAEAKRPDWIVVENVREFRNWGPLTKAGQPNKRQKGRTFKAWIKAIKSLGYQVDHQLLNAADFGAPTKRIRLFIIARRRRSHKDIPWPEPTHTPEQWLPAAGIIDWQKPCPSIFTRKRPLAPKTLRRIKIGMEKFVKPFVVKLRNHGTVGDIGDPLDTITAGGTHHGLCVPFFLPREGIYDSKGTPKRSRSIGEPLPTIITSHGPGHLVMPFLIKYHGGVDPRRDGTERSCDVQHPLPTIDTQPRFAIASPYLLAINHGGDDDRSHSLGQPMATLTAKNGHSLVIPFLTKYYGTGGAAPVTAPVDTITAKDRFGLTLIETMRELGVVDIGFRMLGVDELLRAQGFPGDYFLHGTKAEQVKQIGNSVSPPVAKAICTTLGEAV